MRNRIEKATSNLHTVIRRKGNFEAFAVLSQAEVCSNDYYATSSAPKR
jgi:hypothetical protein